MQSIGTGMRSKKTHAAKMEMINRGARPVQIVRKSTIVMLTDGAKKQEQYSETMSFKRKTIDTGSLQNLYCS